MRLKLTLVRPGDHPPVDLMVTAEPNVTVRDLAAALTSRDPLGVSHPQGMLTLTVRSDQGTRVLRPKATLNETGIRSGQAVAVSLAGDAFVDVDPMAGPVAILHVVAGPDAGRRFPLHPGANEVGRARDNEVVLTDPLVSKKHARVNVTDVVEIVDLGSSNGVDIGGASITKVVVKAEDDIIIGDSVLRVVPQRNLERSAETASVEAFVRSPRLEPHWVGPVLAAPQPPERPPAGRLSFVPIAMPVVFGGVMFAVTQQLVTVLFVALSPLMMVGNLLESRIGGRRAFREAEARFREQCDELRATIAEVAGAERVGRIAEHPGSSELLAAAGRRDGALWSRRPDRPGWLAVRLGVGEQPSRTTIELPTTRAGEPELWAVLNSLVTEATTVAPVPVVAELALGGALGFAGPRPTALAAVRSAVCQLVTLHSPAELVICGLASVSTAADWDWLKWLPHTTSEQSPVVAEHLAAGAGQGAQLLTALEELLDARRPKTSQAAVTYPVVVLVVEDDNGCERSRLVDLAERGARVGIHVLWLAPSVTDLPAACRVFLSTGADLHQTAVVGRIEDGSSVQIEADGVTAAEATGLAHSLSCVADAGAGVVDDSDLPQSVSTLQLVGPELATSAEAILDVWRTSGSTPGVVVPRKQRSGLRAAVGITSGQSLVLDLREQGPHALVGGTTGSGKSEFLQAWVMGMALEHSPSRVTFLFIDYKGGAAFSECTRLPHCVGLVTDLSPHLVRRALQSLNAELRYREHILQRKKAKDLFELERVGDPETPPSLVIVVDEFAALVNEVPEFVDGVVNVAQRGRSLGLNLILATQRPAGVIKDNLRANTNLRIALRMADEADSDDVVGSKVAAGFPPSIPGRGVAKTGPGRLIPFQSGYVGGWTADTPPPPSLQVAELGFGRSAAWDVKEVAGDDAPLGPNDLNRLVDNVCAAYDATSAPYPRRPWLDPLASVYDILRSPQTRNDTELVFGIADDPDQQVQAHIGFRPDEDGNMVVYGTGGAGKSTLLRTLALAAGASTRGGPCHVYALDFGSRGLSMLEGLPHVGAVVNGDDDERIARLIRYLRRLVDERAAAYAAVRAGSISDYRALASRPEEPRVLLLVDNVGAFRQGHEVGEKGKLFDSFVSLAADGRQVGVHVVVSADRTGAVPTSLGSLIQRRLVLRLASENDYGMLSVDADVLASAPPGRGVIDDRETQVLIMGTSPNVADQAALVAGFGRSMTEVAERAGRVIEPTHIGRLPDLVSLGELPLGLPDQPVVGLADETLGPAAVGAEGVLVLAGPPQSGRSTVLLTLALAVGRSRGGRRIHLAPGASAVAAGTTWDLTATGPEQVAETARKLAGDLAAWHTTATPLLLVIENLPDFVQTEADLPLQELIRSCRSHGCFVVAEGETSQMMSSWPLLQAARSGRTGIVLQPEQIEGENLFKTSLPRMSRSQFPPGRGVYVRAGRSSRIQFALPDLQVGSSPPSV